MKIKCNTPINTLQGLPIKVDQKRTVENGAEILTGGRTLTVGEVLATTLATKKVKQFNALKAYALATRLYQSESTDVDEGDLSGLREMMDENESFTPLVVAQVLKALQDAKEK